MDSPHPLYPVYAHRFDGLVSLLGYVSRWCVFGGFRIQKHDDGVGFSIYFTPAVMNEKKDNVGQIRVEFTKEGVVCLSFFTSWNEKVSLRYDIRSRSNDVCAVMAELSAVTVSLLIEERNSHFLQLRPTHSAFDRQLIVFNVNDMCAIEYPVNGLRATRLVCRLNGQNYFYEQSGVDM